MTEVKAPEMMELHIAAMLKQLGEDPTRPGLKETPARVARAWHEWLRGYREPDFRFTTFESAYRGIVARPNVPFQSFCEHHMARYCGHIHFAYIPNGHVLGLSKISRIIQWKCARLTIQEDLTDDIVAYFKDLLKTEDIAIVVTARHSCESTRGAKVDAPTITAKLSGAFLCDASAREEFYQLLNLKEL